MADDEKKGEGKTNVRKGFYGAVDDISDLAKKTPSFGLGQKLGNSLDQMTGRVGSGGTSDGAARRGEPDNHDQL